MQLVGDSSQDLNAYICSRIIGRKIRTTRNLTRGEAGMSAARDMDMAIQPIMSVFVAVHHRTDG
jgi:hypothetical protein